MGDDSGEKLFGLPRENMQWFPSIDYSKCINCMSCIAMCKQGVFSKEKNRPVVVDPEKCVIGCNGCDKICPNGAITHPSKEYPMDTIRLKGISPCSCGGGCK